MSHSTEPTPTNEPADNDLGLEQFLSPSDDQGLSLDALSRTYAQLLGSGEDPYADGPPPDDSLDDSLADGSSSCMHQ